MQAMGGQHAPAAAGGGQGAAGDGGELGRGKMEATKGQPSHPQAPGMGAGPKAPAATSTTATTSAAHEGLKSTVPPSNNPLGEVPESSNQGKPKGKGKPFCYRCHTKGHTISECTVILCCEICCDDHVTKLCPNVKKMNVTAVPCGYAVEGLGFYFIPVAENPKINLEEKSALVRVLEGSLTAEQLAVELEKLLPSKKNGKLRKKALIPLSLIFHHLICWIVWSTGALWILRP